MKHSIHPTSQEAWEWINEYLSTQETEIIKLGGVRSGPQVISYDHFMEINSAWVDPNFDFGYMFGYKKQKWVKLITNYVDMNWLDITKSRVLERESRKAQGYNIEFKFVNTHSSGHGCLISLVFQRRHTQDNPVVIMNIRSSEVTKRLLMDFLLVQRMAEYIYDTGESVSLKLFCGNMYMTAENFVMYHNHKDLTTFIDPANSGMEKRIMEVYKKFTDQDAISRIKYKVFLRSVKRLNGHPHIPLKAKDCLLIK